MVHYHSGLICERMHQQYLSKKHPSMRIQRINCMVQHANVGRITSQTNRPQEEPSQSYHHSPLLSQHSGGSICSILLKTERSCYLETGYRIIISKLPTLSSRPYFHILVSKIHFLKTTCISPFFIMKVCKSTELTRSGY